MRCLLLSLALFSTLPQAHPRAVYLIDGSNRIRLTYLTSAGLRGTGAPVLFAKHSEMREYQGAHSQNRVTNSTPAFE
jgi:hypothetical protein